MRKIKKEMIKFFDDKLEKNGSAQLAIKTKDARSLLVYAYESSVGIREVGKNNSGYMVELIQSTIGSAQREAWCMAFVQTCIAYVEYKTGVISPIYSSEHCLTVWKNTPKKQRVKIRPLAGAIIIWQHGETTSGHTGFMDEWHEKEMDTTEGNTESGVSNGKVVRDGGGVYKVKRSTKGSGDMKILGYLKPF